jgi:hypothetical protein
MELEALRPRSAPQHVQRQPMVDKGADDGLRQDTVQGRASQPAQAGENFNLPHDMRLCLADMLFRLAPDLLFGFGRHV